MDPKNPDLNGAFFLDANSLSLPTGLLSADLEWLASWCAHFNIPLCVPRVAFEEMVHRAVSSLGEASSKLTSYRPFVKSLDALKTKAMIEEMLASVGERLNELSITYAETPKLDQAALLEMAIHHVAPFAANGDRGFKDAVILQTALEYCLRHDLKNAYVVSNDAAYTDEAIRRRFSEKGVSLTILKTLREATDLLQKKFNDAWTREFKQRRDLLIGLVKKEQLQLTPLVEQACGQEDFMSDLRSRADLHGRVVKIDACELLEVKNAYAKAVMEDVADGRDWMSCDARYLIRAQLVPWGWTTALRMSDSGLTPVRGNQSLQQVTVKHSISFTGEVSIADKSRFSELKIDTLLLGMPWEKSEVIEPEVGSGI